jgi:undecaprenyl-diphosphatase
MNLINSIFLGIIEGLTEFLPISSTAHLILASKILNISQNDFIKFFEIFIQSGAILSIISLYSKYILKNKRLILPCLFIK